MHLRAPRARALVGYETLLLRESGAQVWLTGTELAPFDGLTGDAAVWRVADGQVARID